MKMQTKVKAGCDNCCCGGINILSNNEIAVAAGVNVLGVQVVGAKA